MVPCPESRPDASRRDIDLINHEKDTVTKSDKIPYALELVAVAVAAPGVGEFALRAR